MPLPQDIRPVFQDIQDTLVRSEAPWIQQSPMSAVKVLWVGRETGTWASLHHWKKGYTAPPHKHLAGAHAYVISGKLQVRNGVLNILEYGSDILGKRHDCSLSSSGVAKVTISRCPIAGKAGSSEWSQERRQALALTVTPSRPEGRTISTTIKRTKA